MHRLERQKEGIRRSDGGWESRHTHTRTLPHSLRVYIHYYVGLKPGQNLMLLQLLLQLLLPNFFIFFLFRYLERKRAFIVVSLFL